MDKLGQSEIGFQVLRVERLILTNTEDKLEVSIDSFIEDDLAEMMENPDKGYKVILIQKDSLHGPIIKDLALAAFISFTALSESGAHVLVTVVGSSRVKILRYRPYKHHIIATGLEFVEPEVENIGKIYEAMDELLSMVKSRSESLYTSLKAVKDPSRFADTILDGLLDEDNNRVEALNTVGIFARLKMIGRILMELENDRQECPKASTSNEKLSSKNKELQELCDKYYSLNLPQKAEEEIKATLSSLCKMNPQASEYTTQLTWAKFAITLPWDKRTADNEVIDIEQALEKSHYGMKKAKERLVEYVTIKQLNPDMKGCTILLDGPPGTGKTTLALSLGKAMGRKVERISLGGCADPSFIKGHGRTYSGSKEGRIMQAIHSSGVKNPVIILDEVEKVQDGNHGSATAALLELLDPKTNNEFTDAYLCFDFDLSEVLFIATSNDRYAISPPVLDRMEYIACDGYTMSEKIKIAMQYTIPEKAKEVGLPDAKISKSVVKYLIEGYTREPGVRSLEKAIGNCFRKVAVNHIKGKKTTINKSFITKRLGQRMEDTKPMSHNVPGIVSGMYYSSVGGGIMDIEAVITDHEGRGELNVTGQAGDVMMESVDLVRSHMISHDYGMEGERLNDWDIHVHMPEGATPKDGPSAGGAYALLFASLLMDIPVRENLCLTGECNLHGHITPIGGLSVKCEGAIRAGMKIICLPKGNKRDFDEMPKYVKEGAEYHFVETVGDLIEVAFDLDEYIGDRVEEVSY